MELKGYLMERILRVMEIEIEAADVVKANYIVHQFKLHLVMEGKATKNLFHGKLSMVLKIF